MVKNSNSREIYDYIIVGAGISGLYASLKIPNTKRVLIISKNRPWECNSFYAQGGISVARDENDIKSHIEDTLFAGSNSSDLEAVSVLVSDGVKVVNELIELGLKFDRDQNGNLLYTKEGAHSRDRILHLGGDATGRYMHSFLIQNNRHQIIDNTTVIDILVKDNFAHGVTIYRDGKIENIYSKNLILASGGVGDIYKLNTNAKTISGEIHGIAVEKGIPLRDMEMLQFHPTVVIIGERETSLLSEALRGEGAYIVDEDGERFLFQYDERGELASRDIVSRAILKHNKKAYLSISHFKRDWFIERFPTISKFLEGRGFKLTQQLIPISPAFHYAIGGIKTDKNGLVSGFQNLYAVGEVASTGVHGANRLASNSLLEALVFSDRAVKESLIKDNNPDNLEFPVCQREIFKDGDEVLKRELQDLMWKFVSIERRGYELEMVQKELGKMMLLDIGRSFRLQLLTANEIVSSALKNRNSKGVHFRVDM
jgi:L-aspartate oxidase